jgi:hypothetical protein
MTSFNDQDIGMLRDVLQIINKLMTHSYAFIESFLKSDLLQVIIDLFDNLDLIEHLYDNQVHILAKIIGIFFNLCKHTYYTTKVERSRLIKNVKKSFRILRKSRDFIKKISQNENNRQAHEFKIYYIYVFKLVSLKYLQVKFKSHKKILLNYEHYVDIVNGNFVKHTFTVVNDEFTRNPRVFSEFINENNRVEQGEVNKLYLIHNSNNSAMARTIVDVLDNIKFVYTSKRTKKLAFPVFYPFFKSVLLNGRTIERIICLNCLINYCQVETIRNQIFDDKELIEFLRAKQIENSQDDMEQRQNRMLTRFFAYENYEA